MYMTQLYVIRLIRFNIGDRFCRTSCAGTELLGSAMTANPRNLSGCCPILGAEESYFVDTKQDYNVRKMNSVISAFNAIEKVGIIVARSQRSVP